MAFSIIFIHIFLCNYVLTYDSDSVESFNGIELSPFYDAIIFSDIAEIINQFDTNNLQIPKNESESDENIDDLLSEYQHYLEKAHKQTRDYIEKNRLKNKVPAVRHERYYKPNPLHDKPNFYKPGYFISDKTPIKYTQTYNPMDLFLPFNPKGKQYTGQKEERKISLGNIDLNQFKKVMLTDGKALPMPADYKKLPLNSACYCKTNQLPCSCECKQCILPMSSIYQNDPSFKIISEDKNPDFEDGFSLRNLQRQNIMSNKLTSSLPEDVINIRIKVDVQLPQDKQQQQIFNYKTDLDKNSNEYSSTIKLPTSYLNFPIPMNMFGYKKNSMESSPFHKMSIHKKKKSKVNSNKKHKKKLITIHNIKIDPQQLAEAHFGKVNISNYNDTKTESKFNSSQIIDNTEKLSQKLEITTEKFKEISKVNETQTEENVFLVVNISHNILNMSDEKKKINSAEIDYSNTILNATTDKSLHSVVKREVTSSTVKHLQTTTHKSTTKFHTLKTINDKKQVIKKNEKSILNDVELLYWPKNNNSVRNIVAKNITTIILENEYKKTKLNLSIDAIKNNHTRVLEKAIFGDVDWNDIQTVAPAFMSFVGKYIDGVLTFCSDSICHSMKCEKKTCLYRVCNPYDRINNKGHCTGTNNTESVTSMESIMDLPSKVAFEIVDILQERMPGKLFGKVTICINGKCITFSASKKMFIKHKCYVKELNRKGHCVGTGAKNS